jgi:ABC-type amino acid transport substrate-binding protein
MTKQIVAFVVLLIAFAAGWFFLQGPGKDMIHKPPVQAPVFVDTGTPAPPAPPPSQSAAAQPTIATAPPPGFKQEQDTLKSIKANGLVRVSNQDDDAPFYTSAGGAPHGFDVEFTRMLFSDPSFTSDEHPLVAVDFGHSVPEYAQVPKQLLAKKDGNYVVDIGMAGLTFPDNTPAGVKYTIPYVDNFGYALIVKKGSAIKTTADLAGKTVGILKGDPDVKAFVTQQYPNARFVEVDDADPRTFIGNAIDGGNVDAFIYDYPFAVEAIKGTDLAFAVTSLDGSNLSYKIAVRADDDTLLVYLNAAIAKAKQSDDYKLMLLKYFTSDQAVTTAATTGERSYTVKARDTLSTIASAQGIDWHTLQKRNNLPNPNLIRVGQTLVIPRK